MYKLHGNIEGVNNNTTTNWAGVVKLGVPNGKGETIEHTLYDVVYMPECPVNLISYLRMFKGARYTISMANMSLVDDTGNIMATCFDEDNLLRLETKPLPQKGYIASDTVPEPQETYQAAGLTFGALMARFNPKQIGADLRTWHRRLGHLAYNSIKKLMRHLTGIKLNNLNKLELY